MNDSSNPADEIIERARAVTEIFRQKKATLALAESCTGGLCAVALTEIPGVSSVFLCGYTVYSNEAKRRDLGVSDEILTRCGAVSEETVAALLRGLLDKTGCTVAGAVSGIAGPDGGTPEKPVGTVFIGVASAAGYRIGKFLFRGGRSAVRRQSAEKLFEMLIRQVY